MNLWAFLVVILSIVVDYSRSRALLRVARKYRSQALEADALHFATDIWSSAVVLVGLGGLLAAERFDLDWLGSADTVAALGVAAIVVWVSLRLGKKSVDDLLDRIPDDLLDKVTEAAGRVPGVEQVSQVRMRRSGSEVFADVIVSVGQAATFEQAHEIADRVAESVRSLLPKADVVVHAEPLARKDMDLTTKIRMLATRHGMGAHAIRLYPENGRQWLELPVPRGRRVAEPRRSPSPGLGFRAGRAGTEIPDLLRVVFAPQSRPATPRRSSRPSRPTRPRSERPWRSSSAAIRWPTTCTR